MWWYYYIYYNIYIDINDIISLFVRQNRMIFLFFHILLLVTFVCAFQLPSVVPSFRKAPVIRCLEECWFGMCLWNNDQISGQPGYSPFPFVLDDLWCFCYGNTRAIGWFCTWGSCGFFWAVLQGVRVDSPWSVCSWCWAKIVLNAEAQERLFAHLLRRYGRTRKAPATVQEIQKDFLAPAPICNEERVADTVCLSRWAIGSRLFELF